MIEYPKIDFKRLHKELYSAPRSDFEEITVPPLNYLMIDGIGAPGTSQAYMDALGLLYPAAYGIKFYSKIELGRDYVVPPLQGLWWADDPSAFVADRRDEWRWTLMILLPDWIEDMHFDQAMASVSKKKPGLDFSPLRKDALNEGRCLQILHVGSYSDEGPVLHRLHEEVMPSRGLTWNGPHHEIYLGDPRKVAPEKLRTILRQPVKPVS